MQKKSFFALAIFLGALLHSPALFAYSWSESLTTQTTVKSSHITELQNNLNNYRQARCAKTPWTFTPVAAGQNVSALHVNEIRAGIRDLYDGEAVGNSVDQTMGQNERVTIANIADMRTALDNNNIDACTADCPGNGCETALGESCTTCPVDCPCLPGTTCNGGSPGSCIVSCSSDGVACSLPTDCCSNTCYNGTCVPTCGADGSVCVNPSDCCSNDCQGGICMPTGSCNNDGVCTPASGESNSSCPADCWCGDGVVASDEQCEPPNTASCDGSCNNISTYTCGLNGCESALGEDCNNCPGDCGTCVGSVCGNGIPEAGEDCDPPDGITCDASCQSLGGSCTCNGPSCTGLCGFLSGTDSCTADPCTIDCGGCPVGESCNGNLCETGACVPDGSCSANCLNACGTVAGVDNCGNPCSSNCGGCPQNQVCNANVCEPGPCIPSGVCSAVCSTTNCGTLSGVDTGCPTTSCTVNCGSCTGVGETCTSNTCVCTPGACGGVDCTGKCGLVSGGVNNCGTPCNVSCPACPGGYLCQGNACVINTPCGQPNCYRCSGGACILDTLNPLSVYSTTNCNNTCSQPKYRCSAGSCVRDDVGGTYTTSNCDGACFTCSGPACTGVWTTIEQNQQACGPGNVMYRCVGPNNPQPVGTCTCPSCTGPNCCGVTTTLIVGQSACGPGNISYTCTAPNVWTPGGACTCGSCGGGGGGGGGSGACPDGRCEPDAVRSECNPGNAWYCPTDCNGSPVCCGYHGCQPALGENCSNCADCACTGGNVCQGGSCVGGAPSCTDVDAQCTSWVNDGNCGAVPCAPGRINQRCNDGGPCDGQVDGCRGTCPCNECSQGTDCGADTAECYTMSQCGNGGVVTGIGQCIPDQYGCRRCSQTSCTQPCP